MPLRADRAVVVLLLVVLAGYTFGATRIFVPLAIADPLGPRAFPLFLGIVGIVLCIWILLDLTYAPEVSVTPSVLRDLAGIAAALATYAVLLPRLGFILATAGVLTAGFMYTGARRPAIPAAIFAVLVYLLFTRVLGIWLPSGIFPWL